MSTLASRTKKKSVRSFRPTSALAQSIDFTDDMMNVHLLDGRVVGVPLAWFPRLLAATPKQRKKYEIGGGGIGLHWPDLDEDLSVAGLLAGADQASG
jgi:hypothetical protein